MASLMDDLSSGTVPQEPEGRSMLTGDEDTRMSALVVQAQQGHTQAFEAIYVRYHGQISRYLSRIVGNDGIGCELTQETFLKAWSSLPGLRSPERFLSWLYRIATNCSYTYQKKYARLQQEIPLESYLEEGGALFVEGPERKIEESEMLRLALSRVSLTYRPCLILYIIEDLPQRQIAELLDIKEASVSKYVSRGIEELRQIYRRFEEMDRASSSGRSGKS